MSVLLSWLVLTLAVWVAAFALPGVTVRGGALSYAVVAGLFGVLNWVLGWLLFVVIGIGTLGLGFLFAFLTRWVVNAIVLKMTSGLSSRFEVRGFGTALIAALIMSGVGTGAQWLIHSALGA